MTKSIEELFSDALMQETANKMKDIVTNKINSLETELLSKIADIKLKSDIRLDDLDKKVSKIPLSVNLGTTEKPKNKIVHRKFDTIIKILQSAKRINKNIMLVGNSGSGKNVLCSDVAEALKLEYYPMSVGLQTTKSDLLGFINAHGEYVTTPVRQAFENGGLLLLDEFDASHAGVATILNSLLANDVCSFPDKIVKKHENFICFIACNTYGKGGSIDYIGRNRLDGATLDRFISVEIDYDDTLESKLTKNKEWLKIIRKMRKNIQKFGLKVILSPRASMQGADLLDAGFSVEEVLDMVVFKGLGEDSRQKICQDIDFGKLNKNINSSLEEDDDRVEADILNPIILDIDVDNLTYKLENVVENIILFSGVDWDGDFNIHLSSSKEWANTINGNQICFNFGSNKILSRGTTDYGKVFSTFSTLIAQLQTYGHNIKFDTQSIKIIINYEGSRYVFNFGKK